MGYRLKVIDREGLKAKGHKLEAKDQRSKVNSKNSYVRGYIDVFVQYR